MDILKDLDLLQIAGGGYWWRDSAGIWHYNPSDEEPDDDGILWE